MTPAGLRWGATATAALVLIVGAAFPAVVAERAGAGVPWETVADGALYAALPAVGLVWTVRLARDHRLASWAALVGAVLTLGLGVALYAAALRPDARPSAPVLALAFVPLRQAVAVAFVAWAVWLARRTR
ncbi:hypothetical protein [Rubrivirga sp.]|uniref:hypothetical protein n=1 Tax=Rubrivirga sp. TaxID=1885344 RepID=UPI003B522838